MDTSRLTWHKSSYSGSDSNCVEVGVWRKSSYSGSQTNCVEVGVWREASHSGNSSVGVEVSSADRAVAVRDSKDPAGPQLSFAPGQWQAFVGRVKAGVFDPA
jgi:hypothetical protein